MHNNSRVERERPSNPPVPWMHGAAGIAGGATSMTIFYPLDYIRTRLQSQDGTVHTKLRSVREITRQEGVAGLYRGVTMAVASHSLGWGSYLTLFRTAQGHIRSAVGHDSTPGDFAAACLAAATTSTIVTPLNLVKTRTQLHDDCSKKHLGVMATLRQVAKESGWKSLFRGLGPQVLLSSHTTIQVALYECLARTLWGVRGKDDVPIMSVAIASALSKSVAVVICNPLEVCRTRMQDQRNHSRFVTCANHFGFRSTFQLLRHIHATEGARGMYRGTAVNVLRVIPTTVVAFIAYEKCLSVIHRVSDYEEVTIAN